MLKKTIKYTDYDGNEREEDFYFNLTRAECIKMQLGTVGGLEKMIDKIVSEQDIPKIIPVFEKIILSAYGEKSLDGRRFMKSQEISDSFAQTEAYSNLFIELLSDGNAAAEFVKGVVPPADEAAESASAPALQPLA